MKNRSLSSHQEAEELELAIFRSAGIALRQIADLYAESDVLHTLWSMKFRPVGCDPLNSERPLNIIEQINQTFTYLASVRAAKILLDIHPECTPLTLNLGNVAGTDIESNCCGGVACEVFAAVNTSNNQKLAKDLEKVSKTTATHKYVFFMCPGVDKGRQPKLERISGIQVWSVGGEL